MLSLATAQKEKKRERREGERERASCGSLSPPDRLTQDRSAMDLHAVCRLLCLVLVAGTHLSGGIHAEKNPPCEHQEFYNNDIGECIPCSICIKYPKTPSCDTCPAIQPQDSWRVAAITSFSVLAALVVFGGLLIGVLVHQCMSRRTLREPIEETTGPLYPV